MVNRWKGAVRLIFSCKYVFWVHLYISSLPCQCFHCKMLHRDALTLIYEAAGCCAVTPFPRECRSGCSARHSHCNYASKPDARDNSSASLRAHVMTAYMADDMLVSSLLATQGSHCGTVVGPAHNRFNQDQNALNLGRFANSSRRRVPTLWPSAHPTFCPFIASADAIARSPSACACLMQHYFSVNDRLSRKLPDWRGKPAEATTGT